MTGSASEIENSRRSREGPGFGSGASAQVVRVRQQKVLSKYWSSSGQETLLGPMSLREIGPTP